MPPRIKGKARGESRNAENRDSDASFKATDTDGDDEVEEEDDDYEEEEEKDAEKPAVPRAKKMRSMARGKGRKREIRMAGKVTGGPRGPPKKRAIPADAGVMSDEGSRKEAKSAKGSMRRPKKRVAKAAKASVEGSEEGSQEEGPKSSEGKKERRRPRGRKK